MGTRGVWSLDNVEVKYPVDDWVDINEVALIPSITASNNVYWLGGSYNNSQSVTNTTDKTDMSTFTTSALPGDYPPGPANYNSAGTSGNTHGYVCGKFPGYDSKCSKLTYATEVIEQQMMNLSSNRGQAVGTNSSTNGYVCGGQAPGSPWALQVSIVDRITNSSDSLERLPACNLVQGGVYQLAACGTQEYGYIGGGVTPGPKESKVSKIEYSTETNALSPGASLTIPRSHFASTSNSTHAYWYAGKAYAAPVGGYTTSSTDKTTFATDTTAAIPAKMSYLTDFQNANGNTTHALVGGGYWNPSANPGGGSAQAYNTRMDKVTYSSDTISNSPSSYTTVNRRSAGTTGARNNGAGTTYDGDRIRWKDNAAQDPNWGVFIGGKGPSGGSVFSKIDFAAEYAKKLDNVPGSENYYGASMGSSPTKAYLMMGASPSWPWSQGFSFVFKYTYATTTWGPYTPYTDNRGTYAASLDSTTATTTVNHGGNAQGQNQAYRVTHATDATSTVPGLGGDTPGMPTTYSSAGTSNIGGGVAYVCGGESSNTSQTDKITFSSDTRERLPSSDLPTVMRRHTGAGGPTAAYYYGGDHYAYSNVYKFNWSDETYSNVGAFTPGNGPGQAAYGGSTGNSLAGYFYGGNEYSTSNIMKILYSTDTTSTLTGKMEQGEQPSPGYNRIIQNGSTSVRESNRANMIGPFPDATPTATKSPKPYNTSDKAYYTGGHTSSNIGYPNPVPNANLISSTDKLTMASETVALAPGANLPTARYHHKAMSSSLAAYIGGGFNNGSTPNPTSAPGAVGGGLSNMIKIPYATDTTGTMPNLSHVGGAMWQGGGNDTKGYFTGSGSAGSGGPYGSRADKITFATDTVEGLSNTGWGRGHGAVGVYEGPSATGGGGVYFTQGEYAYPWHPSGGLNNNTTRVMITSTDTGSDVPSLTMLPFAYLQSHSNPTHWIVYGGMTGGQSSMRSSASKATWATETESELPSSTGENLSGAGSAGNNTYGFAGGGRTTSSGDKRSYTMRYTFESDTFEFRPSTHLTNECKFLSGTSAKEHANPDPYYITTPNVI